MGFLTPWLFSFSILIAGFLVLYFYRKQYKELIISQTFLWDSVRKEWEATKWYQKLQHNILFWLQLFVLILLILSLAQPYLFVKGVPGEKQILIIDTSASMATVEEKGTRFDTAKSMADELLGQFQGQDVVLIEARREPTVLIQGDKASAQKAIEELTLSYEKTDLNQALSLATTFTSTENKAAIHIFSDQLGADQVLTNWKGPLYVHNIGETSDNVSIESFGVARFEDSVQGLAMVTSEAAAKREVTVQVKINDQIVYKETKEVAENQPVFFTMKDLPVADIYQAEIIEKDALLVDNIRSAFLEQSEKPTIIVNPGLHPYVIQALEVMGYETIKSQTLEESEENPIFIVEGLSPEQWPVGPLLVFNPMVSSDEGGFKIQAPIVFDENNPIFSYVDMENVFIEEVQKLEIPTFSPLAWSRDTPVFYEGERNGEPVIIVNFNLAKTDWPLHSSFPIFLFESIEYLKQDSRLLGYYMPGEEADHFLEGTYQVLSEEREIIGQYTPANEAFEAPYKPGLYSLFNGEDQLWFSVMLEDGENKTKPKESFTSGVESNNTNLTDTILPIANWLILLAFMILLIEWEVYRRGV